MKKQNLITRLLPLIMLVAVVLTGCKDEPEIDFGFSEDISTEGFKFGPDGGYGNMDFRAPENSSPKVSVEMIINPNKNWLSAECRYDKGWKIYVRVDKNDITWNRYGFVYISVGKSKVKIAVSQAGDEVITFMYPPKILSNRGGDFVLEFETSGTPQIAFKSSETAGDNMSEWLKFGEVRKTGTDKYELPVSFEPNNSFGRIMQLSVSTKWASKSLSFIQRPVSFGDSVTVMTDISGGSLPLMLGYIVDETTADKGVANIHGISHLVIKGGINDCDLDVLREITNDRFRTKISLDLSDAEFVRSDNNPFKDYGYIAPKKEFYGYVSANNCIPDNMFHMASGLVGCVLSEKTVGIGREAFKASELERIDIPDGVESIGEEAFNCRSLKEINIGRSSKLRKLGFHFLHVHYIDNLFLPRTLTEVADNAFLGMKVHNLYLDKTEPPTWKEFTGENKRAHVDTLYLPDEKLIDVYRAAPGWDDIPTILVWPQSWEDEDEDWL